MSAACVDRPISPDSDSGEEPRAVDRSADEAVLLATLRARYRAQMRAWAAEADRISLAGIDCLLDMVRALHMSSDVDALTTRMDDIARRLAMSDPHVYFLGLGD